MGHQDRHRDSDSPGRERPLRRRLGDVPFARGGSLTPRNGATNSCAAGGRRRRPRVTPCSGRSSSYRATPTASSSKGTTGTGGSEGRSPLCSPISLGEGVGQTHGSSARSPIAAHQRPNGEGVEPHALNQILSFKPRRTHIIRVADLGGRSHALLITVIAQPTSASWSRDRRDLWGSPLPSADRAAAARRLVMERCCAAARRVVMERHRAEMRARDSGREAS